MGRGNSNLCGLRVHIDTTINHSTSDFGYTRGRTVVDAMASISQYRANMIKPSLTQQSTIILKGSAALVLVLMDVHLWQGCFFVDSNGRKGISIWLHMTLDCTPTIDTTMNSNESW